MFENIVFQWFASETLRRQEFLAGSVGPIDRKLIVPIGETTQEQRARLLEIVQFAVGSILAVDIRTTMKAVVGPGGQVTDWKRENVELDREPTIDQAINLAAEISGAYAQAKALSDRVYRERRARADHEREVERSIRAALSAADDDGLDALENLKLHTLPGWGDLPDNVQLSISHARGEYIKSARAELRKLEKIAWIDAHGSEHLRRAFAAGHDSQRRYITERAALEAPGYTVDFTDNSNWKDRPFPSLEALDELERMRQAFPGVNVRIVWLISPASEADDADDEEFEPCEAIVVGPWLEKYYLIKTY